MDSSLNTVVTRSSESKHNNSQLYTREYELNDNNYSNSQRSQKDSNIWSSSKKLVWRKCRAFIEHNSNRYNIFCQRCKQALDVRNSDKISRSSTTNRHNYRLDYKYYYYILISILTISFVPVLAEEPEIKNTANPVAAATGNVTNQAIQFQNNGAASRQNYGSGIACIGSTMTFSPFYMGNHVNPYSEKEDMEGLHPSSYQLNENWGFQLNFMVPLDNEGLSNADV